MGVTSCAVTAEKTRSVTRHMISCHASYRVSRCACTLCCYVFVGQAWGACMCLYVTSLQLVWMHSNPPVRSTSGYGVQMARLE